MFYEMTSFTIVIDKVSWQPKNQINLLTFKIKNNCLALNWPLKSETIVSHLIDLEKRSIPFLDQYKPWTVTGQNSFMLNNLV